MNINKSGIAVDGRGREIQIVATHLEGEYPVLGVQMTNKGTGVSKDGVRLYTATGKFYSNGRGTVDELDLVRFTPKVLAPTMLTMTYSLNGTELARKEVVEDSDEHSQLESDGWETLDS